VAGRASISQGALNDVAYHVIFFTCTVCRQDLKDRRNEVPDPTWLVAHVKIFISCHINGLETSGRCIFLQTSNTLHVHTWVTAFSVCKTHCKDTFMVKSINQSIIYLP